jgi:hypothetical protein
MFRERSRTGEATDGSRQPASFPPEETVQKIDSPALRLAAAALLILVLALPPALARSKAARLPEDPRDVPYEARLSTTEMKADLDGDGLDEGLILVSALTGADDPERGSEVILGVTAPEETARGEQRPKLLWVRHVARETGRLAHSGELTAVDLDGDGGSELVLSWDRSSKADRRDRFAEIWAVDGPGRFRNVWQGPFEVDTRRDESVPLAPRQRYEVSIDYGATRRLAGRGLVLRREYSHVAGQALSEPRVTVEEISLRLRP